MAGPIISSWHDSGAHLLSSLLVCVGWCRDDSAWTLENGRSGRTWRKLTPFTLPG